jgi:hypothetical protein
MATLITTHYCCGVDFQYEIDEGMGDVYSSVEDLKNHKSCWEECGIVKFELNEQGELVGYTWILKQKL